MFLFVSNDPQGQNVQGKKVKCTTTLENVVYAYLFTPRIEALNFSSVQH